MAPPTHRKGNKPNSGASTMRPRRGRPPKRAPAEASTMRPRRGRPPKRAPAEATPALDARNLDSAFSRRDSDAAASLRSSRRPASSVGPNPNFSDRATQAAALRVVNAFLAPAVTLGGPLPDTRDIQVALRTLLSHLHLPLNDATFEDDLVEDLGELGYPYKVTCAALRSPVTPHSWPTLLSVLHWLTLFVSSSSSSSSSLGDDGPAEACSAPGGTSFLLYTTQAYYSFMLGDDAAVEALDKVYYNHMAEKASDATVRAPEKEAQEHETEVNKLTSGPSRRQALELEKEAVIAKLRKYDAVVETWETKVNERVQELGDLEKVLEAKVSDAKATAAENAQLHNVRDAGRMHREMQVVQDDIASAEKGRLALEDKDCELETKLVTKLEDLGKLAEQCNQAHKRLKPGIDFQYMINAKGSSPAEILGTGYKTVLKQGLVAHADENRRIRLANLEEVNDLQKQMQGNVKALEGERNNISSLQATNDNMVACLNSLDREMTNDDSRFTSEARQMNDELEKKKNSLISVEMQADDFFKISEKRLQDARLKADEETQVAANKLRELVYSMAEHKEFMETIIAQRRKDLREAEDYIASLASR